MLCSLLPGSGWDRGPLWGGAATTQPPDAKGSSATIGPVNKPPGYHPLKAPPQGVGGLRQAGQVPFLEEDNAGPSDPGLGTWPRSSWSVHAGRGHLGLRKTIDGLGQGQSFISGWTMCPTLLQSEPFSYTLTRGHTHTLRTLRQPALEGTPQAPDQTLPSKHRLMPRRNAY